MIYWGKYEYLMWKLRVDTHQAFFSHYSTGTYHNCMDFSMEGLVSINSAVSPRLPLDDMYYYWRGSIIKEAEYDP